MAGQGKGVLKGFVLGRGVSCKVSAPRKHYSGSYFRPGCPRTVPALNMVRFCDFDDPEAGLDMVQEEERAYAPQSPPPAEEPSFGDSVLPLARNPLPPSLSGGEGVVDAAEVFSEAEPLASSSPLKRRRLRCKQSAPSTAAMSGGHVPQQNSRPGVGGEEPVVSPSPDFWTRGPTVRWRDLVNTWGTLDHRARYRAVYRRFGYWVTVVQAEARALSAETLVNMDPHVAQLARHTKSGAKDMVHDLIEHFVTGTEAPKTIAAWVLEQWRPRMQADGNRIRSKTILLTWNGPWGDFSKRTREPFATTDIDEVVKHLRGLPGIMELWLDLQAHIKDVKKAIGAREFALSLELCPRTWANQGGIRVHCHAFFMSRNKVLQGYVDGGLAFQGIVPVVAGWSSGSRNGTLNSGMYYCVAPKIGSVLSYSTQLPFKEFPVDGEWIMNMLQAEKMTAASARVDLIKTAKGLCRRIADLDKYVALKEEDETAEKVERVQSTLACIQRPFKVIPKVTAFLKKYLHVREPIARKKILALDGPSGVGKTEYVRSLFLRDALLEINAASMQAVCLPSFNQRRTRCILWDECGAELVSRNRKVFQHGTGWVDIGHSPTAQHIRRYFLNDCVSIIASNRWVEDVDALPSQSDRDWVYQNTVVVTVNEPLWMK